MDPQKRFSDHDIRHFLIFVQVHHLITQIYTAGFRRESLFRLLLLNLCNACHIDMTSLDLAFYLLALPTRSVLMNVQPQLQITLYKLPLLEIFIQILLCAHKLGNIYTIISFSFKVPVWELYHFIGYPFHRLKLFRV